MFTSSQSLLQRANTSLFFHRSMEGLYIVWGKTGSVQGHPGCLSRQICKVFVRAAEGPRIANPSGFASSCWVYVPLDKEYLQFNNAGFKAEPPYDTYFSKSNIFPKSLPAITTVGTRLNVSSGIIIKLQCTNKPA